MTIFMLSPKQEIDKGTDDITVVPGTAEGVNEPIAPVASPAEQKELDEKTILLDGPLSQVYTQALNQAYAKESYITELAVLDEVNKDKTVDEQKDFTQNTDYVYVVNGHFLEDTGYVDAFESLRFATETYKNVSVCVEHDLNITPRVAAFLGYARQQGAVIFKNRIHAMEMLSLNFKRS